MPELDTFFAVFIDYDNLTRTQKNAGILDVVTKALIQLSLDTVTKRAKCEVRIYGGWYEGNQITRRAEDVTIEIQREFPLIIRLPNPSGEGYIGVSTNAELAVAMLQEPSHHLFNTYRRKGKPTNIRVEAQTNVGCEDSSCALPLVKKFIDKGRCPKSGCSVENNNLIYRHEQKIVDTMLSCDLIYAASKDVDHVVLVSGDD
ncbi:MAG: NYN domain-containing protein, partial [Gammaproteobacteria bacterium]|nr:NYN domain-containing protein [Gammaproteobacteria bacterium]